jgi:hypothetical protein
LPALLVVVPPGELNEAPAIIVAIEPAKFFQVAEFPDGTEIIACLDRHSGSHGA